MRKYVKRTIKEYVPYEKTIKEYVPYEKTININRAPTDESVALLNEMQEKTLKNMLQKEVFNNDVIKGEVVHMMDNASFTKYIIISFYLNNNHITERVNVDEAYKLNKDDAFRFLVKALSKKITEKIMISYAAVTFKNL